MTLEPAGRALAVTGGALFLAGLVQGLFVDAFANPRMALSAHLDAVQSGMAVMIAGAFWSSVRFGPLAESIARWTLAVGMVGLWMGITLAAMTGASEALPMAGEGYSAAPFEELVTMGLIVLSSVALLIGWLLFLFGLIRRH